jgi:hypothetical protein
MIRTRERVSKNGHEAWGLGVSTKWRPLIVSQYQWSSEMPGANKGNVPAKEYDPSTPGDIRIAGLNLIAFT